MRYEIRFANQMVCDLVMKAIESDCRIRRTVNEYMAMPELIDGEIKTSFIYIESENEISVIVNLGRALKGYKFDDRDIIITELNQTPYDRKWIWDGFNGKFLPWNQNALNEKLISEFRFEAARRQYRDSLELATKISLLANRKTMSL